MQKKGDMSVRITREDFIANWKLVREYTASSISTLHFEHYKAAALDENLSKAHTILLDMATKL